MTAATSESPAVYVLAQMALDTGCHTVSGPRGHVQLTPGPARLLARLMRRPGAVVSASDLISAMYPDPDEEPEHADVVLRSQIQRLRALVEALAPKGTVQIRNLPTVGYAIETTRQAGGLKMRGV